MAFNNDLITNMMKMHASSQAQSYSFCRLAWVKDYDPATNCVKVGFFNVVTRDWDLMSGWLPHVVPALGKGDDSEAGGDSWGFQHPPNINEQVVVVSHDADFSNALVIGAIYSKKVPPPQVDGSNVEMGEFQWVHKSGSYIKFWNDGSITLYTTKDFNLHSDENGNIHILGDLQFAVDGAITFSAGKGMVLKAASQITLDAPSVNTTKNLTVGTGATGTFNAGSRVVTVMNGIVTLIV